MITRPKAYVVDDDAFFLKALQFILDKFGVQPVLFQNSEDCLKSLSKRPDLLLVDLNLGSAGSGYDLISAARKMHGLKLPIIVISGSSEPQAVTHSLEIGANDFIRKPLDKDLLAAKLGKYIQSPEILEHRSHGSEPPGGKSAARVSVSAQVSEIDELGIKLLGPNLLPKGTVLKLEGDLIQLICANPGATSLVTVSETWMESDGKTYGAYAEFDSTDEDFLKAIRKWLSQSQSMQSAQKTGR